MWKFQKKKKMVDFFLFHVLQKGHFMENGIIEGAIALILKHYKAHFDL